jgi:hypothetical protein
MAVVGVIAGLASAAGSIMGGMQAKAMADYQAEVAKNNAKTALYNAQRAGEVGGIEAQMKDLEHSQVLGEQAAQQAASGVAVSGPSQVRSRAATRLAAAADRQTIYENMRMESYGHQVDMVNFKAEAKARKAEGKAAMLGGVLGAIGGITSAMPTSLLSKSTSSFKSFGKTATPTMATIPRPRPKPTIGINFNPLTRTRMTFGH